MEDNPCSSGEVGPRPFFRFPGCHRCPRRDVVRWAGTRRPRTTWSTTESAARGPIPPFQRGTRRQHFRGRLGSHLPNHSSWQARQHLFEGFVLAGFAGNTSSLLSPSPLVIGSLRPLAGCFGGWLAPLRPYVLLLVKSRRPRPGGGSELLLLRRRLFRGLDRLGRRAVQGGIFVRSVVTPLAALPPPSAPCLTWLRRLSARQRWTTWSRTCTPLRQDLSR